MRTHTDIFFAMHVYISGGKVVISAILWWQIPLRSNILDPSVKCVTCVFDLSNWSKQIIILINQRTK